MLDVAHTGNTHQEFVEIASDRNVSYRTQAFAVSAKEARRSEAEVARNGICSRMQSRKVDDLEILAASECRFCLLPGLDLQLVVSDVER